MGGIQGKRSAPESSPFTVFLQGRKDSGKIEFFNAVVTDPEQQCPPHSQRFQQEPGKPRLLPARVDIKPRLTRNFRGTPKQYEVRLYYGHERHSSVPNGPFLGVRAWLYFISMGPYFNLQQKRHMLESAPEAMNDIRKNYLSKLPSKAFFIVTDSRRGFFAGDIWLDVARPLALAQREAKNRRKTNVDSILALTEYHFTNLPLELVVHIYRLVEAIIQHDYSHWITRSDCQLLLKPPTDTVDMYFGDPEDEAFIDKIFDVITF